MYNRYIPEGASYARIPADEAPVHPRQPPAPHGQPRQERQPGKGGLSSLLSGLGQSNALEGIGQALGGVLKGLHLEELDTGDILLALIVLLLVLDDGDELDLIITLGLTILLSLGDGPPTLPG